MPSMSSAPKLRRKAAKAAKAQVFIQMSALGADADSTSEYARTKAAGEAKAKAAFPGAIIMRPSIVFGPEDNFFNQFAALSRLAPALPLIGGGNTKFTPIFVGDLAEAFARLVDRGEATGQTFELGGPEVFTFKQILEFTLETIGRKRLLIPVPWPIAKVLGRVMGILPFALLTADQVELLKTDNVVSEAATREGRDLASLGIKPTAFRALCRAISTVTARPVSSRCPRECLSRSSRAAATPSRMR